MISPRRSHRNTNHVSSIQDTKGSRTAIPGKRSCTRTLRIMFRDLSRPVCIVPISRLSALETCFQPLVQASSPLSERRSAAQLHDHQPIPLLTPSAAGATVVPDRATPLERPHVIGQSRRHRRCTRPPHLGRARSVGGNRFGERLAQTGMGQHEIVIDLEQRQLLAQPVFTLTRRGAAPSHRCHALAQAQIEPLDKSRVDLPAAGGQHLLHRRLRANDHVVFHLARGAAVAWS